MYVDVILKLNAAQLAHHDDTNALYANHWSTNADSNLKLQHVIHARSYSAVAVVLQCHTNESENKMQILNLSLKMN